MLQIHHLFSKQIGPITLFYSCELQNFHNVYIILLVPFWYARAHLDASLRQNTRCNRTVALEWVYVLQKESVVLFFAKMFLQTPFFIRTLFYKL